ncbi:DNA polymerase III subunit epsilon [Kushneria pakistanensis]|uniref:DNA polymerase III subunit epsilon n=1 Tax=Kushneria pakistanensis TaxID=1508770 RepID=A0ABQ3FE08_9GAMM|nr:DNA polymerase III subunit epsilon [Kushneria pakistanensis]GHC19891.1 DNA polymerase III subunit epsilon [Kushneria pakistanensis]
MRQIILDTETTGIEVRDGHRLIEIGGVEVINRRLTGRHYHQYINPERAIDPEAIEVHGITDARVANEPVFADIAHEFWDFVKGAELVIHNAPFDVGFIDHEFAMVNRARGNDALGPLSSQCSILDTLKMARDRHPGQRNNLDALCKRYDIDNGHRELHGALLDAEILADVYLAMTGGQTALILGAERDSDSGSNNSSHTGFSIRRLASERAPLRVITANDEEAQAHQQKLAKLREKGACLWDSLGS